MKHVWPRSGRTLRLAQLVAAGFVAVALGIANPAQPVPIYTTLFGAQLYYTGGDLTVDVLHSNTVYDEVLQLRTALRTLDVAEGSRVGSRVTLTERQLAELGINVGDELQFGIHVRDTGNDFLLGPGHRNADGLDHAYVRTGRNSIFVGFEDLLNGGDRDYNDTIFRFTGGMTTNPAWVPGATTSTPGAAVPEPSALMLLLPAAGLLALGLRKR